MHLLKLDKPTLEKRLGFAFHKGLEVSAKATFVFPAGYNAKSFLLRVVFSFKGQEARSIGIKMGDVTLVKEYGRDIARKWVAGAIEVLRVAGKLPVDGAEECILVGISSVSAASTSTTSSSTTTTTSATTVLASASTSTSGKRKAPETKVDNVEPKKTKHSSLKSFFKK